MSFACSLWNEIHSTKKLLWQNVCKISVLDKFHFESQPPKSQMECDNLTSFHFELHIYCIVFVFCFGFFFINALRMYTNFEPSFFFPHCKNENIIATHASNTHESIFICLGFDALQIFFFRFFTSVSVNSLSLACRV